VGDVRTVFKQNKGVVYIPDLVYVQNFQKVCYLLNMNGEKPHKSDGEKSKQSSSEKEEDLKRQVKELNKKLMEAQETIEKNKTIEERFHFVEEYFKNLNNGYIKDFKNRMAQAKETDEQLIKDLVYITYNTIDLANFVSNGWKPDTYNEGNIDRIFLNEPEINPNQVRPYSSATGSAYVKMIIKFLRLNYGIDHIDHLIGGYDINDELKKGQTEK